MFGQYQATPMSSATTQVAADVLKETVHSLNPIFVKYLIQRAENINNRAANIAINIGYQIGTRVPAYFSLAS